MGGTAAVLAAGTVISTYGTYQGYQAARKEAKANKRQARLNAFLAGEQAKDIKTTGMIEAKALESDAVRFGDEQISAFVSGGIDISSGVVSQAVEDTARIAAADIITLQHNVAKDAWAVELGGEASLTKAEFEKSRARRLSRAGNIALISSILAGIGTHKIRSSTTQLPGGA